MSDCNVGKTSWIVFWNKQEMKTISRSCKSNGLFYTLLDIVLHFADHLDKLSEINLTNIMDYVILFSL